MEVSASVTTLLLLRRLARSLYRSESRFAAPEVETEQPSSAGRTLYAGEPDIGLLSSIHALDEEKSRYETQEREAAFVWGANV